MHHFAIVFLFIIAGYETDALSPIRATRPSRPCACTADYSPICGSDGVTYSNECQIYCGPVFNSEVKLDCQGPCPCKLDVCLQPKLPGQCKAYQPTWFYNINTKQCEQFMYGGCKGNGNRFDTKEQCEKRCVKKRSQDMIDICKQPKVVGRCLARGGRPRIIRRWFYDTKEADCIEFRYSGCEGSANNFKSRQQCLDQCLIKQ